VIICGLALLVAFGLCFWQNHRLLNVLNRALPHTSSSEVQRGLAGVPSRAARERAAFLREAAAFRTLASSPGVSSQASHAYRQAADAVTAAANALPTSTSQQEKPITIGVGEPFVTTLTVCGWFALLFTLPLLIYQAYAFVIPALNPGERRVALPAMGMAPVLFIAGVLFAYIVVLPPAVRFLQGYNNQSFDILVQARTYYKFEIFTMLGVGVAFQLPLGLLALQRLGAVSARTLTRHWRYAVVIIAVIAAAMPGADPVTTALETLPLILLYLASIVLLKIADRRAAARAAAESGSSFGDGLDPT
jgi:sec-independent protein translocase protein TatC